MAKMPAQALNRRSLLGTPDDRNRIVVDNKSWRKISHGLKQRRKKRSPMQVLRRDGDAEEAEDDDDEEPDEDEDGDEDRKPTSATATAASSVASQTGQVTQSLGASPAAATVLVPAAIASPPLKGKDGDEIGDDGGLSDPAKKGLIAGGSIAATILLFALLYFFLRFRKGKSRLRAFKLRRRAPRSTKGSIRGPGGRAWSRPGTWVKPTDAFDPNQPAKQQNGTSTKRGVLRQLPFPTKPIFPRQRRDSMDRSLIERDLNTNPQVGEVPMPAPVALQAFSQHRPDPLRGNPPSELSPEDSASQISTPREVRRQEPLRFSVATRSDMGILPRFRTIESWVDRQAGLPAERSGGG